MRDDDARLRLHNTCSSDVSLSWGRSGWRVPLCSLNRVLEPSRDPVNGTAHQQIGNDRKECCDNDRVKRVDPVQDDELVDTIEQTRQEEKFTDGFLEVAKQVLAL